AACRPAWRPSGRVRACVTPSGSMVQLTHVDEPSRVGESLALIGLGGALPTLVVVGGATGLEDRNGLLRPLAERALIGAAEAVRAYVVDGGTDAGVMKLVGRARSESGAGFPLIGVVAEGTAKGLSPPSPGADQAELELHHTHFIVVPGSKWGDETPWISLVASTLSAGRPSATVLIGGGDISWTDVSESVAAERPVLVIDGSGGAADELARALRGEGRNRHARIFAGSYVEAISIREDPARIRSRLVRMLSEG
ncbi:MAG: hypothetical protein M3P01_09985, partial [Actinomycetota bacterium]|nr:hypothetical protein [Actinomycetota bacterium]